MIDIEGYIDHIVYHNELNGYTVMVLSSGNREHTLTGKFPAVSAGEYIKARGDVTNHPSYGEQINVTSYSFVKPGNAESSFVYLSSGAVKGVGEALAKRITDMFGDETFSVIEESPELLAKVKGISKKKALEISEQVREKRDMRQAVIYLSEYGISQHLAAKIYKKYGHDLYALIKENPYRLADEIDGIGFKIADDIARKAGVLPDSEFRIRSGLIYALMQEVSSGHTCIPIELLKEKAGALLGIQLEDMEHYIMDLVVEKRLMVKEQKGNRYVYASYYYYQEQNVARMLYELNVSGESDKKHMDEEIKKLEAQVGISLDPLQKKAVTEAICHGLLILTGGPGTGKTTTINMIIKYFERQGLELALAAPTGRAAKRMSETCRREAKTIHRLLEVEGDSSDDSGTRFNRNEETPLEYDVIIIDEMSMVDISIMHALLKAVTVGTRLIFSGDSGQLPSVGPGNVLKDMINSEMFHVVKLEKIFRQAALSEIIVNAHLIKDGKHVELNKYSKDFLFIHRDSAQKVISAVITLVKDKLPKYVKAPIQDIQVLTPMKKGVLGSININKVLQEQLNPPSPSKEEKEFPHALFREGDNVMQVKNDYQAEWEIVNDYNMPVSRGQGIFNGDMGIIRSINHYTEEILVEFDDKKRISYSFKNSDELELSYAVTIHKSQGSEYPAVVLPLLSGPGILMNRNILYTAVTRARKCVTIVGSEETFKSMIRNGQEQKRYSGLDVRIKETYGL